MEVLMIMVAGLLATIAMTILMYGIHWSGLANGDMVRAIGSLITRRSENALLPGLSLHLMAGMIFAVFYVTVWSFIGFSTMNAFITLGAVIGFAQGLVVSIGIVIAVAEHHPLEQFRKTGFGVALTHVAGHVVYGLVLGAIVGAYSLGIDMPPAVAAWP